MSVFLQPGPPAPHLDTDSTPPKRPTADGRTPSESQRFPFFDREPFRPVTEFLPQFEMNNPTHDMVMTGATGPAGPTLKAPPEEKTPPLPALPTPPLLPSDTYQSGNCRVCRRGCEMEKVELLRVLASNVNTCVCLVVSSRSLHPDPGSRTVSGIRGEVVL